MDTNELHYMPPEVWVPIQSPAEGMTEAVLELRETTSNGLGVVAYSSLENLVAGCGESQPFALLPANELDRLRHIVGFSCVILDVGMPEEVNDAPLPELEPDAALATGHVYLPSRPHRMGANHADIKLFELDTGEMALLAYSSPQLVRACLGLRQSWVAVPAEAVEQTCYRIGADVVVFDHKP